jgi:hypothetical protein
MMVVPGVHQARRITKRSLSPVPAATGCHAVHPGQGLTTIQSPCWWPRVNLAAFPAQDARVLLLSDCVHNTDPGLAVRRLAGAAVQCCWTPWADELLEQTWQDTVAQAAPR